MLVLTRKVGQTFTIGTDVVVTVLEIRRDGHGEVRLGIDAPDDVQILRDDAKDIREGE